MSYTNITAQVTDQIMVLTNAPLLASGGVNETEVAFAFCSLWDGYTKTAVFYRSEEQAYHVLMINDAAVVPAEVTADDGLFYMGVFGVNSAGQTRTSSVVTMEVQQGAITKATAIADPTPDIYLQLLTDYGQMRARLNTLTALPNGSTAGDAELADIRVGYDGTEYETAGEAVRGQIKALSDRVQLCSDLAVLEADPPSEELLEGRMWILKTIQPEQLTTPVITSGMATGDTVTFNLNNASYDESGLLVDKYNVYVNGVLYSVAALNPGSVYTIAGLDMSTTYSVTVCGVKGSALSAQSNALSVTTNSSTSFEYVFIVGARILTNSGSDPSVGFSAWQARATAATDGGKYLIGEYGGETYYFVPLSKEATTVTVMCEGMNYGFAGWNVTASGDYSYDIDSGWRNSGEVFTFPAGRAECYSIAFKRNDNSDFPDGFDMSDVVIMVS